MTNLPSYIYDLDILSEKIELKKNHKYYLISGNWDTVLEYSLPAIKNSNTVAWFPENGNRITTILIGLENFNNVFSSKNQLNTVYLYIKNDDYNIIKEFITENFKSLNCIH